MNQNRWRQPKQGFTLLELMITISIIVLIALVSVPNLNDYQSKTEFNDKVTEIQTLINQMGADVRNPGKDYIAYQIIYSNNAFIYQKKSVNNIEWSAVKTVLIGSNRIVNPAPSINCLVEDEDCTITNSFVLSDNNTNPVKMTTFTLSSKPLRAEVTAN